MSKHNRRNPFLNFPNFNPTRQRVQRTGFPGGSGTLRRRTCSPRSTACRQRPEHKFETNFASIKEARAFLEFKVPAMSDEECARNLKLIERAEKMVKRADRRNQRRKLKRQSRVGLPAIGIIQRPKKKISFYEETFGPNGEIIRFKLIHKEKQFVRRVRTKEDPPVGSIILDLTSGVKAWKRYSDKRRSIPITAEMRRSYQNSFLYKVRQLAAGLISRNQFNSLVSAASSKSHKKLLRKNRKNR